MSTDEKRTMSIQEAMVQNAEYFGFDLYDRIDIGGGEVVEIMYRELLDAPTRARVDEVYRQYELCDRTSIEIRDSDGKVTETIQGPFKDPREKDGEPFDLEGQVCIALWGEEVYKRYINAGGPPGLPLMAWGRMRQQISNRLGKDSKSS